MRIARLARLLVSLAASACSTSHQGSALTTTDVRPAPNAPVARTAPVRPRLVVSVIIDQLGSATLRELAPLLAPDGLFAHVSAHGRVYDHAVYPYAATLTAPGHAAVYSGHAPDASGITTNYLVERATGTPRAIVDDRTHAVLGVPGKFAGPGALRVPTVADALETATGSAARVASLSLKDRSAILPAGKHPDLVLWFDGSLRAFTSSTYYAQALPGWLDAYQRAHPIAAEQVVWKAEDPAAFARLLGPDAAAGEGQYKGLDTSFPHELSRSTDPYAAWVLTPASTEALLALALETVQQLGLGRDEVPDLLAISISGTDHAGHAFGPRSWEYADHLRKADRALMRLLRELERQTTVALLVTSDHGAAPLPEQAAAAHPNATRIDSKALAQRLEQAADAAVGAGDWIAGVFDDYVYLSPAARSHPRQARIRAALLAQLRTEPGIALAHDLADPGSLPADDALAQQVRRSLHPDTSGDIFVVPDRYAVPDIGMVPGAGTTHGSPWPYDTHVPVLLLAPGLTPARSGEAFDIARVSSTLAALLGVPAPRPDVPPLPGIDAAR
jgi:Type I phosphodiesterase / nucleotide pyrophosphatase